MTEILKNLKNNEIFEKFCRNIINMSYKFFKEILRNFKEISKKY